MVGGWASWFAAASGAERVLVLEKDLAGQGASSRAAGVVRAQGGTPATVALGRFSIEFYRSQQARLGTDSGFRELGYLILAVTKRDVRDGNARVEMQRDAGLDVRWVDAREACSLNPTLATDGHRGGSFCATDGAIDPPRNVRAYSLAMQQAGVDHVIMMLPFTYGGAFPTEAEKSGLDVTYTLYDPRTYSRPWSGHAQFRWAPELRLSEYICEENNRNKPDASGKLRHN